MPSTPTDPEPADARRWGPASPEPAQPRGPRGLHRLVTVALTVLVLGVLGSAVAARAADASRYLTLDDPAYEGLRLLRDAGYLQALNPMVQPYRRAEVAAAVAGLDPDALPAGLAPWARQLRAEFPVGAGPEPAGTRWGTWAGAGLRAARGERYDPLRPLGDPIKGWPYGRVAGWLEQGPFATEVVVLGDRYLRDDPDGENPQRRIGRTETAYVSFAFPHGEVALGRFARNWSMLGTGGLMVGDAATPYAQLGLTLSAGRFRLHSFLGELDTLQANKRYLAAHRMDLVWPNLILSFGESILFAGEHPGFPLRHLNPVEVFYFESDAPPEDLVQNLMLDWSVWYRRGPLQAYLEALLDDIDLTPPAGADREPTSYALTLGGRWALPAGHTLGLEYTRVSAWSYRTPFTVDRYSYLGRGLGANFSDFDLVTVSADLLAPGTALRVTPKLQVLRQGEGDFRQPIPDQADYLASPNLFLGTKETTVRAAVAGRIQPSRRGWLAWDLGVDRITDAGHVPGRDRTAFEGTVEAGVRFDPFPFR